MTFRPDILRGAPTGGFPGQVDFRLARNHLVREYHRGRLSRLDICDAHPELLRAARNVGAPTETECPICEDEHLVHVTYAFGARLPAQGKLVDTLAEMSKLKRRVAEAACYVVEVCPNCAWNHLARTFPVGGTQRARA